MGDVLETTVSAGRVRGRAHPDTPGVVEFLGVPYATAQRWEPPRTAAAWDGVLDATVPGPVAPQLPSPGARVMGPRPDIAHADEQCLNLIVRTPAVDRGRRPVVVWVHGGAYVEGAGSFAFYDAARLVAEGDVVVVNVNYRLGVLGFLRGGPAPGNLGLLDLHAALDWVRAEIAAFGGDPDRITVAGQSAGAHAAASLVADPRGRTGIRRLILQSGQFGLGLADAEEAARSHRYVTEALAEVAGPAADLHTATTAQLLDAQRRALRRAAGFAGLRSAPPLCPVAGVAPLPAEPRWRDAVARAGVDVLVGATADEAETFVAINPMGRRLRHRRLVGPLLGAAVSRPATRRVFTAPALEIADGAARSGGRAYSYLIGGGAPASGVGACHAIELPFLFGRPGPWRDAPMLAGLDVERDLEPTGGLLRAAWLSFVRDGDPSASGALLWPPHIPGGGPTMHLSIGAPAPRTPSA